MPPTVVWFCRARSDPRTTTLVPSSWAVRARPLAYAMANVSRPLSAPATLPVIVGGMPIDMVTPSEIARATPGTTTSTPSRFRTASAVAMSIGPPMPPIPPLAEMVTLSA